MTFRWAMLAPVLTITGVAVGFPLGYALYLSLTDYRLTSRGAPDFVGLDNYFFVLTDPRMWNAFSNTAIYVIVAVALQTVLGLAIALALQKQKWARDLTRAMLLAPMFITPIAVGLTFRFLLNDQLGAIPAALRTIGISYDFFGPGNALVTLAFIDVWQWTPFMVLLLLAGLESIPRQPLEAARGGRGERLVHLPPCRAAAAHSGADRCHSAAVARRTQGVRVRLRDDPRRAGHRDRDHPVLHLPDRYPVLPSR